MAPQDFKLTVHWLESSRAQRVLVLLEELNIEYDMKTYKRDKDGLAPPELAKVHPLGKSPTVVIEHPGQAPLVIAESAVICAYIADHWGKHLVPQKWIAGKEEQIGGETEAWMRNTYFDHYIEGSLMSLETVAAVILNIQNAPVPFFIKPVTKMIAGSIRKSYLDPNFKNHFNFLEERLATSGGDYLCGPEITLSDIMIIFPLQAAKEWAGLSPTTHGKLCAYLDRLMTRESYNKAQKKAITITGGFKPVM